MGLDITRGTAGKAFLKSWAGRARSLKLPTLFDLEIKEKDRIFTSSLRPESQIKLGDSFVVHAVEKALVVYDGFKEIGRAENPAPCILAAVRSGCGIAEGTVERIGLFRENMELSIR